MSSQLTNGDWITFADTTINGGLAMASLRMDVSGQTRSASILNGQPSVLNVFPEKVTRLTDGRFVVGTGVGGVPGGLTCILDTNGQATVGDLVAFQSSLRWYDVAATADSGMVVCGNGFTNSGLTVGVIARYDKHLGLRWAKVLTQPNAQSNLLAVEELADGGIMVAGYHLPPPYYQRACLLRLNDNGNLVWTKSYSMSAPRFSRVFDLHYDGKDMLYLVGDTTRNWSPYYMALMAIDTAGTFQWGKLLDHPNGPGDVAKGIVANPNGTLVVYGTRTVPGLRDEGVSAAFTPDGDLLWDRAFSSPTANQAIDHVDPHQDGGYMWMLLENTSKRLVKTDGQGGMSLPCGPASIQYALTPMTPFSATNVTGFYTAPVVTHTPVVFSNTSITLSNQLECGSVGNALARPALPVQVFPQPMYTHAQVRLPEGIDPSSTTLEVYDLAGHRMPVHVATGPAGMTLARGGLPAGIYAYQVLQGGQRIASGKLWLAD